MEQTPQRKATWRMGARERSRLQWAVVAIIAVLLLIALRPAYLGIIETRNYQVCQGNVRKLALALTMYSRDWDDTLPPASTWTVAAQSNMASTSGTGFSGEHYLKCPIDGSAAPSSYAYNELFGGLALTVKPTDTGMKLRRETLGRVDRAPVVIEKHGSPLNARVPLGDWNAVAAQMTRPHNVPAPTGSMITGDLAAGSRSDEQLGILADRRF